MNRLFRCLLWALLLLGLAAAPARALVVAGIARDPTGRPVARVLVSDGERVVASGTDGIYRLETRPGLVVAFTAPPGQRVKGRWWLPVAQAAALNGPRLEPAPPLPKGRIPLAVVSDPHLFSPATASPWVREKVEPALPWRVWQETVTRLQALRPALTLLPGDLCMDAERGDQARARAELKLAAAATAMLPTPWRAAPGNHDLRYDGGKVSLALWREFMGPARGVYFLGPVAVILLDNVGLVSGQDGKLRSRGKTGPTALAWLKSLLALLPPDTPLLLVSHFPLLSPLDLPGAPRSAAPSRPVRLARRGADRSRAQVWQLLEGRPLVGLIHGHLHAHMVQTLQAGPPPLLQIGAPALCGNWWRGDLTTYGELHCPPGFLEGWLFREHGRWQMRLPMMEVKRPRQP